jgi:hypothetical protein
MAGCQAMDMSSATQRAIERSEHPAVVQRPAPRMLSPSMSLTVGGAAEIPRDLPTAASMRGNSVSDDS